MNSALHSTENTTSKQNQAFTFNIMEPPILPPNNIFITGIKRRGLKISFAQKEKQIIAQQKNSKISKL